jgi:hypothetical protein
MTNSDRDKFAEKMAMMQEVFCSGKPVSETKIEIYYRYFQQWNIEDFVRACNAVLSTKTISTFPLPAEIEAAAETNEKPLHAWLEVKAAMGLYGAHCSLIFADKKIRPVVRAMGGWEKICHTLADQWMQKEFERLYKLLPPDQENKTVIGMYWPENIVDLRKLKQIKGNNASNEISET